jgi:hypothetical protein
MAAPEIVPAGSLLFGGMITGVNQYLRVNGLANGPHVPVNGSGSLAIVPVPSRVYAVAWNFERNAQHNFHLTKWTKNDWQLHSILHFPKKSGVLILDPLSDAFAAGDGIEIMSTDPLDNFPGPIIVTLYLAEL